MMSWPGYLRRTVLGVVIGLLLAGCGEGGIIPPAAIVDGTAITQQELGREVDVFLALTPDARTAVEGPSPSAPIQDLNRNALAFLIQQALVERYAARNGIQVDAGALAQSLEQAVQAAGGPSALDGQLQRRKLTDADVRDFVGQVALRQALAASLSEAPEQQDQAFGQWLLESLAGADVEVNPRFGVLDPTTGQLRPVTSTDDLD